MKIFDVHSHWGTRRGYPLRSEAELAQQRKVWNSDPRYHSEEEMADYFRAQGVQTILDFGFTKNMPIDEVRAYARLRASRCRRSTPTSSSGCGCRSTRRRATPASREFERCMAASRASSATWSPAPGLGKPADDPIYDAVLRRQRSSQAAGAGDGRLHRRRRGPSRRRRHDPRPTAIRATSTCWPRQRPNLTIIAGRPAWPWQDDMIAVHAAQAERLVRAARLVAEIPHRRRSSATSRAA